ncbi:MAG: ion transporter [Planctomycetota bacterium]
MYQGDPSAQKSPATQRPDGPPWRVTMHDVIFESDTPAGWTFDVALLVAILCSIVVVALETTSFGERIPTLLTACEWLLTILFSIEYIARLVCARRPIRYALSFWGIIDLLSILPTFAAIFFAGSGGTFVILRSIRLLRAFRVLKLWRMMDDAEELSQAIWKARHKIVVFLMVVLVAVTISGTLMFFIENELPRAMAADGQDIGESQFDSIPQSMYWAIVTMTTVGYGDIVPRTTAGKFISATLILLGYSLIIVPSGFVTAALTSDSRRGVGDVCPRCGEPAHPKNANYCFRCGERLPNR